LSNPANTRAQLSGRGCIPTLLNGYASADIQEAAVKDYGADPLGNGKFKMVPSGDIVDYEERMRRLPRKGGESPDGVFGKSWGQIAQMQGGYKTLDVTRKARGE
jgi:hypothetical protein